MKTVEERKHAASEAAEAFKRERRDLAQRAKQRTMGNPPAPPPDDDGLSLGVAEATLRSEREALASLVTKRSLADDAYSALSEERAKIAYAAHTGDRSAERRLREIHAESASSFSEKEALTAAIDEAKRRVAGAELDRVAAEEAVKARQVLGLLDAFREHGAALDEAARSVVGAYNEFRDQARAIRGLGVGSPSEQILRVASRRALVSGLIGTDLEVEMLAPRERHSFSELIQQWSAGIEGWAHARLPRDGVEP